jgi:hypothetical protein
MKITSIIAESQHKCPHCGGPVVEYSELMEKKDACYYKVKASAKVWPSAYASGRLVQCRKKGAGNYGNKSESIAEAQLDEKCWDTHKQVGMKNKGGRQVPNCVPKESVAEVAPPGAKAERMVKHIKKSLSKDGKLSDKEKSIAYATAWKAHNKSVTESSQRVDSLVTDALKIMQGSEASDAVAALKTVLGDREYNSRRGYYNFYVRQLLDMSGQQGVAEGLNEFEVPVVQGTGTQAANTPRKSYSVKIVGRFTGPQQNIQAVQVWQALEAILPRDYPRVPWKQQTGNEPQRRVIDDINNDGFSIVKQGINSQDIAETIVSKFESKGIPAEVIDGGLYEEDMSRKTDAKGRTQQQWIQAVQQKFPDAKIMQAKMIDGPVQAILPDGRKLSWNKAEHDVAEEYNAEYDDEAGMADNNLETLDRAVEGLDNLINSGDNLPEWCQEKIAVAKSMLVSVWDYMYSEEASDEVDPEIDEMFEAMDQLAEEMARKKGVSVDLVWETFEAMDDNMLYETAAWRRKEGKSKKGGLNAKGVASYRRENPGSKLQMAVTTKPSKLKPGSKAAKRRKSFCARMGGVKGPMKKPNGKPTRKALALRKWNC